MDRWLKVEGLGIAVLAVFAYHHLAFSWTHFWIFFFVPDVSFLAYLINTRVGAVIYNLAHHMGLWSVLAAIGWLFGFNILLEASLIVLAHSGFDRTFGYGLKYPDSFQHTHLGWIGKDRLDRK